MQLDLATAKRMSIALWKDIEEGVRMHKPSFFWFEGENIDIYGLYNRCPLCHWAHQSGKGRCEVCPLFDPSYQAELGCCKEYDVWGTLYHKEGNTLEQTERDVRSAARAMIERLKRIDTTKGENP
jgi:hypothetical protein